MVRDFHRTVATLAPYQMERLVTCAEFLRGLITSSDLPLALL